jgi:hypothetical protein
VVAEPLCKSLVRDGDAWFRNKFVRKRRRVNGRFATNQVIISYLYIEKAHWMQNSPRLRIFQGGDF